MLKFDPDEDDEDGTQSQSTQAVHQGNGAPSATSSQDAGYNCPNAFQTGQDSLSPVNATPNPTERGSFPYTQQDTRVS